MAWSKYSEDNERRKEENTGPYPADGRDERASQSAKNPKIDDFIDHHAAYLKELARRDAPSAKEAESRQQFLIEQKKHFKRLEEEEAKKFAASLDESNEWLRKRKEDEARSVLPQHTPTQRSSSQPSPAGSAGTGCLLTVFSFTTLVAFVFAILKSSVLTVPVLEVGGFTSKLIAILVPGSK